MISVTVRADEVVGGLTSLATTIKPAVVMGVIYDFLSSVQIEAKRQHRYIRRTGRLERSVKIDRTEDGGSVYIDEGAAPYGKYIHEGTKFIDRDPFLTDAFDRKEADLYIAIAQAMDQTIQQAGL